MGENLAELRDAAVEFARIAGKSTLKYYQNRFEIDYKSDDSPVTVADREAEMIIRNNIKKHFPDHGIIGEEFGKENEDRDIVWILDPIDGTKSFLHGIPFYTTLIGILVKNESKVGVIYAPALDEMVSAAEGLGCDFNGEKATVRECKVLSEATFLTTDVQSFYDHGYQKSFEELMHESRYHRTWGDAYGHMMVAIGRADIMVDAVLNVWDAAALLPILQEAGGSYSDLMGNNSIYTGNALSTNKFLKNDIIRIFDQKSN
tara:strand:+ start:48596 stop:49375 length:780 start_codon:yes stop_codon:yes gene_type:complete